MPTPSDPSTNGSTVTLPKFVTDDVTMLFSELTAPEEQVIYSTSPPVSRPTLSDINGLTATTGIVNTFELRTGPSDLDSYHDFYTVQFAFEDVWQQLTADQAIYEKWNALMDATLGQTRETDRTKQFTFVDGDGKVSRSDGTPVMVGTTQLQISEIKGADDLKAFLAFLQAEFGLTDANALPMFNNVVSALGDLVNVCADLFNQINRVGHNSGDQWSTGVKPNSTNDGNWPDDIIGTDGNNNPTGPFLNLTGSTPTTRYQYLQNTMDQIRLMLAQISATPPGPTESIKNLLAELDTILAERYSFDVFAPNSINYGLVLNYRQHWEPIAYQVGDLVSTIPLAPQEVRKYTTRQVTKQSRNVKEMQNSLRATRDEMSDTTRLDGQIVSRARNSTNFQQNASGSFGNSAIFKVSSALQQGTNQSVESDQTKNDFHEATSKAAQEYRNEHKSEVDVSESQENDTTSYREIRNPNDELTVTYLFYELQRRYSVQETLNKVTPVILVANDVPSPHEIDEAWLVRYDWIIKRVILDDSYLPALDYLSNGYTGTELQLKVLELEVQHQRSIVDQIAQQVSQANSALNAATIGLQKAENKEVSDDEQAATLASIKSVFDPLGLSHTPSDAGNADRARVDFAKDALDRAQTKTNQLLAQLKAETTALQIAIDKYVAAAKTHYDKLEQINRLRAHVKDYALHYMQGIWTYEKPDERYFRLYDIEVPTFTHSTTVTAAADTSPDGVLAQNLDQKNNYLSVAQFPVARFLDTLKLHQVADIDNLLGFKGNYMMFPVVNFNYMNWFMMKDYLQFKIDPNMPGGGSVQAKDPDPLADVSLADLETAFQDIYAKNPASFIQNQAYFQELMRRLMEDENDEIIVPSHSLYIEALPGTHPLLEDFKLIHRAVDVKRAQADLRHAELENLRSAARLQENVLGDPDVDKVILVRGDQKVTVDAGE